MNLSNLENVHIQALKNIMIRYIKRILSYGIKYQKSKNGQKFTWIFQWKLGQRQRQLAFYVGLLFCAS